MSSQANVLSHDIPCVKTPFYMLVNGSSGLIKTKSVVRILERHIVLTSVQTTFCTTLQVKSAKQISCANVYPAGKQNIILIWTNSYPETDIRY